MLRLNFLDGDNSSLPFLWCLYFAAIRFASVNSHEMDFNNRNQFLTTTFKLLKQGYLYHKNREAFNNSTTNIFLLQRQNLKRIVK